MIEVVRAYELTSDQTVAIRLLGGESFYRSPDFARLWQAEKGKPVFYLILNDKALIGFLPGVEFGFGPLKRFQSMPNGCYGGLVLDRSVSGDLSLLKQIQEKLGRILLSQQYVRLIINDYYSSLESYDLPAPHAEETMIADIADSEWQPHDSVKRGYDKAVREGLTVLEFDFDLHFEPFWKLMRGTEQRHGQKPKYSETFFKGLAHLAKENKRVIWKFCEHEKKAVASHIYFIENDSLIYWQGYSDKRYSSLHPNQYLLYLMARQGQKNGLRKFNLGSSPDEAEGLKTFKERLGGKIFSYPVYDIKKGLGKLI